MVERGRTIRLFLVDGSPTGLITAEIMNWTGKVLSFPRGLLPDALKRPEVAKTGVYFLVGPDPDAPTMPLVYVGESDDVAKRLKQHDSSEDKDFFEQVALVISKDENLTKSHARYLEARIIEIIKNLGTATFRNSNQGSPVLLPEAERADMEYVLEQLHILLPVLGYSFFQEVPKRSVNQEAALDTALNVGEPIFEMTYLEGKIQAEAYMAEGQFIVMAGATCRHPNQVTPTLKSDRYAYIIDDLKKSLADGVLIDALPNETVRLTKDKAFKSPSRAASFVAGTPMSGHYWWRLKGTQQTYGDWRKAQVETIDETAPLLTEAIT